MDLNLMIWNVVNKGQEKRQIEKDLVWKCKFPKVKVTKMRFFLNKRKKKMTKQQLIPNLFAKSQ